MARSGVHVRAERFETPLRARDNCIGVGPLFANLQRTVNRRGAQRETSQAGKPGEGSCRWPYALDGPAGRDRSRGYGGVTFFETAERLSSCTPGELVSVTVTRARLGNASRVRIQRHVFGSRTGRRLPWEPPPNASTGPGQCLARAYVELCRTRPLSWSVGLCNAPSSGFPQYGR
jgi:hypothetical protein